MKKVAILYGVAEGSASGRQLRRELRANGWSVTRKVVEAELVIAHSGGAFRIPIDHNAKVMILVGLPTLVSHHILIGIYRKFTSDLRQLHQSMFLLRKSAINVVYSIVRPIHHFKMWRGYRMGIHRDLSATRFVVIRNRDDIFSSPEIISDFAGDNDWTVLSMYGDHDDIWANPARYVELANELYDATSVNHS